MEFILEIQKARKASAEGTLKQYPSGLVYQKRGSKWVYFGKRGSSKTEAAIEEAKKEGRFIEAKSDTSRDTAKTDDAADKVKQNQKLIPTSKRVAEWDGKTLPTKEQAYQQVQDQFAAGFPTGLPEQVIAYLRDHFDVTDFTGLANHAHEILNPVLLVEMFDGINGRMAFENVLRRLAEIRSSEQDIEAGKEAEYVSAWLYGDTPDSVSISMGIGNGPGIRMTVPYDKLDNLDTLFKADAARGAWTTAKRKIKKSVPYQEWVATKKAGPLQEAVKSFEEETGVNFTIGSNGRSNVVTDVGKVRKLAKLIKDFQSVIDFRKYDPPSKRKLSVRLMKAGGKANHGVKAAGSYSVQDATLNISPSMMGTIAHESGHYFWYQDTKLQDEFMDWARESGLTDKIDSLVTGRLLDKAEVADALQQYGADQTRRTIDWFSSSDTVKKNCSEKGIDIENAKQGIGWIVQGLVKTLQKHNGDVKSISRSGIEGVQRVLLEGLSSQAARTYAASRRVDFAKELAKEVAPTRTDAESQIVDWFRATAGDMDPLVGKAFKKFGDWLPVALGKVKNYINTEEYGRLADYWSAPTEIFARTFRNYTAWKAGYKIHSSSASQQEDSDHKKMDESAYGWDFPAVSPDVEMLQKDGKLEALLKKHLGGALLKSIMLMLSLQDDERAMVRVLKKEGRSKNRPDSDFDKDELELGTKIELEHTRNRDAAKEIAKDHLVENSRYYSEGLIPMEQRLDAKKSLDVLQKARKKSAEGTLKKYPSGLIYQKRGDKWVYFGKVGSKKTDAAIEDAKKNGMFIDSTKPDAKVEGKKTDDTDTKTEKKQTASNATGSAAGTGSNVDAGSVDRVDPGQPTNSQTLAERYRTDGIYLSREGQTEPTHNNYLSKVADGVLRQHQKDFVNTAYERFKDGFKGVLNEDGTGAGKTLQELALAQTYLDKNPDATILITTQNWSIISDAFEKDGAKLGMTLKTVKKGDEIDGPGIYITAYSALDWGFVNGGLAGRQQKKYDLLIADESHNFKNVTSQKTQYGLALEKLAKHVGLFSATPIDKAEHIQYICEAMGMNFMSVMTFLGYSQKTFTNKATGVEIKIWERNAGVSAKAAADRIDEIFTDQTSKGLCVKREVSLSNLELGIRHIELNEDQQRRYDAAESFFETEVANNPKKKGLLLLGLRRLVEEFKIEDAVGQIKKDLDAGKQSVVFSERLNESGVQVGWKTEVRLGSSGPYYAVVPDKAAIKGTSDMLVKHLEDAGIKYVQLTGETKNQDRQKAIDDFNKGKVKVFLTTPGSGGTGINLDDTVGNAPRAALILTPPFSAMSFIQTIGRINRLTTKSKATATMLSTNTMVDGWNKNIIANKVSVLGGAVSGDYKKIEIEDLDAMSRMSEDEAKAFAAAKYGAGAAVPVQRTTTYQDVRDTDIAARGPTTQLPTPTKAQGSQAAATFAYASLHPTATGAFELRTHGYNQAIVDAIRGLDYRSRSWDADKRVWRIHPSAVDQVKGILSKHAEPSEQQKKAWDRAPQDMQGRMWTAKKVEPGMYEVEVDQAYFKVKGGRWQDFSHIPFTESIGQRGTKQVFRTPAQNYDQLEYLKSVRGGWWDDLAKSIDRAYQRMFKGGYPTGTVRSWKGGKYVKKGPHTWVKVVNGKEVGAEDQKTAPKKRGEPTAKPKAIRGDQVLLNALKRLDEGARVYLDDLQGTEKKAFDVLTKYGFVEVARGEHGEYKIVLTEKGKAAVENYHAGRAKADRESTSNESDNLDKTAKRQKKFETRIDTITATKEFKRWFGKSKVVDSDGKPMVMYHGTGAAFSEFDLGKTGVHGIPEEKAFFFSSNVDTANSYADTAEASGNVIPVFLKMENPYVSKMQYYYSEEVATEIAEAKRLGHDGITFPGIRYKGESGAMAVFAPTQIKSLFNKGTFNSKDKDIRKGLEKSSYSIGTTRDWKGGKYIKKGPHTWVKVTESRESKSQDRTQQGSSKQKMQDRLDRITSTPEFKKWFKDSKVVDKNGKPKVVFHGSPDPKFTSFEHSKGTEGEGNQQSGPGFYFTTDPESASNYSRSSEKPGGVYPVFLSIQNPIEVDFVKGWVGGAKISLTSVQVRNIIESAPDIKDPDGPLSNYGDVRYEGRAKLMAQAVKTYMGQDMLASLRNDFFNDDDEKFLNALQKYTGHDGWVSHLENGNTHWVAWRANQIKSIFNKGTFSENEKDISKADTDVLHTQWRGRFLEWLHV